MTSRRTALTRHASKHTAKEAGRFALRDVWTVARRPSLKTGDDDDGAGLATSRPSIGPLIGLLAVASALALVGCGGEESRSSCTEGQVVTCPCVGGATGVQVCGAGSTFGPCSCDPDAGGLSDGGQSDGGQSDGSQSGDAGFTDPDGFRYWRFLPNDVYGANTPGNLRAGGVDGLAWSAGGNGELFVFDEAGLQSHDFAAVFGSNAALSAVAPTPDSTAGSPQAWIGSNFDLGFFDGNTFTLSVVPDLGGIREMFALPEELPFEMVALAELAGGFNTFVLLVRDGELLSSLDATGLEDHHGFDLAVSGGAVPTLWFGFPSYAMGATVQGEGALIFTEIVRYEDNDFGSDARIVDIIASPWVNDIAYVSLQEPASAGVQCATNSTVLVLLEDDQMTRVALAPGLIDCAEQEGMVMDAQGRIWFLGWSEGSARRSLHVYDPDTGALDPEELQPLLDEVSHLENFGNFMIDPENRFWMYGLPPFGTAQGGVFHTSPLGDPLRNPTGNSGSDGGGDGTACRALARECPDCAGDDDEKCNDAVSTGDDATCAIVAATLSCGGAAACDEFEYWCDTGSSVDGEDECNSLGSEAMSVFSDVCLSLVDDWMDPLVAECETGLTLVAAFCADPDCLDAAELCGECPSEYQQDCTELLARGNCRLTAHQEVCGLSGSCSLDCGGCVTSTATSRCETAQMDGGEVCETFASGDYEALCDRIDGSCVYLADACNFVGDENQSSCLTIADRWLTQCDDSDAVQDECIRASGLEACNGVGACDACDDPVACINAMFFDEDDLCQDTICADIACPTAGPLPTFDDADSGLTWMVSGTARLVYDEAVQHCLGSTHGGFSDWRLPSIDELRTLIRNCARLEPGGSCQVTNSCNTEACFFEVTDGTHCGETCSNGVTCRWPEELGECAGPPYWSATPYNDESDNSNLTIWFLGGMDKLARNDSSRANVRCIRNTN